jgi:hypothetical protein
MDSTKPSAVESGQAEKHGKYTCPHNYKWVFPGSRRFRICAHTVKIGGPFGADGSKIERGNSMKLIMLSYLDNCNTYRKTVKVKKSSGKNKSPTLPWYRTHDREDERIGGKENKDGKVVS